MNNYYIRAAWGFRPQTIAESAKLITNFMVRLQQFDSYFKIWCAPLKKNLYSDWSEFSPNEETIINLITAEYNTRKQPDIYTFLNEGHNLLVSNNLNNESSDSLRFSLGWTSHSVENSTFFNFTELPNQFSTSLKAIKLIELIAEYWSPEYINFTTSEIREVINPVIKTIVPGWITYVENSGLSTFENNKILKISKGSIIIAGDTPPNISNSAEVQKMKNLYLAINNI